MTLAPHFPYDRKGNFPKMKPKGKNAAYEKSAWSAYFVAEYGFLKDVRDRYNVLYKI